MAEALTAVRLDMLLLANKNMKRYRRTWYNYPRTAEVEWLKKWFGRSIGISWLDDNRGLLKKGGWVKRWQTGRRADGGIFRGSTGRGQFSWQTVCALASRGITVFRDVYALAKKSTATPSTSTAKHPDDSPRSDEPQLGSKENPFEDRAFRIQKDLKPDPPFIS